MIMKHFKLCAALAATLCTGTTFATNHVAPGSWGLDIEYLYMKPTVDDTYFVIKQPSDTNNPIGSRINNDFDFHSGFRVGVAYGFCECGELQAYYTRLSAKQTKTVTGENLYITRGSSHFAENFELFEGSATSDLRLLYERVDANYDQLVYDCCGLDIYMNFGLEYAFLRFQEAYIYSGGGSINFGTEHSRTWGVGPQLGFEFDYKLCEFSNTMPGILSLNFLSSGSLLVGEGKSTTINIADEEIFVDVTDRSTTRIIPALHSRVALKYSTCFSNCFGASFEIGYEFNSYLRGMSRINFESSDALGLSTTNYYNFDVQGLFISALVSF